MYDSDEEHGIELPGPWSSNRDYIYDDLDKDDAYDSDSMEHSTHGNKHSGSSGSGNGKEREIVLGDYQKANKEYQQQQTSNNPMYRSGRPSLSKYSPTNANKQNKTNYTSYDLPEASDEEYGLEQDDL